MSKVKYCSNHLVSVFIGLLITIAFPALAKVERPRLLGGCLDCFNFAAPTIGGAESVVAPEVGLIVFDSNFGSFRGLNSFGKWSKLSNEKTVTTATSAVAVSVGIDLVLVNSTSGPFTVTMPAASDLPGRMITVKKVSADSNLVSVQSAGGSIDGSSTSFLANQFAYSNFVSDGTNWNITGNGPVAKAPKTYFFTSGTGTYQPSLGANYVKIKMYGAGGGGGAGYGSSTAGQTEIAGAVSTFGGFITMTGGGGGSNSAVGTAGSSSFSSLPPNVTKVCQPGSTGNIPYVNGIGGGSGGQMVAGAGAGSAGSPAGAATGSTGSGGGGGGSYYNAPGAGGGSGGVCEVTIVGPTNSYGWAIGAGGAGGSSVGSGSFAGGSGAGGSISIEEY